MADSFHYQHFQTLLEVYEIAHPEKNKNSSQTVVVKVLQKMKEYFSEAVQKKKSKVTNKSLSTINQTTAECVTVTGKTNPQPSKETPPSTSNAASPILEVACVQGN